MHGQNLMNFCRVALRDDICGNEVLSPALPLPVPAVSLSAPSRVSWRSSCCSRLVFSVHGACFGLHVSLRRSPCCGPFVSLRRKIGSRRCRFGMLGNVRRYWLSRWSWREWRLAIDFRVDGCRSWFGRYRGLLEVGRSRRGHVGRVRQIRSNRWILGSNFRNFRSTPRLIDLWCCYVRSKGRGTIDCQRNYCRIFGESSGDFRCNRRFLEGRRSSFRCSRGVIAGSRKHFVRIGLDVGSSRGACWTCQRFLGGNRPLFVHGWHLRRCNRRAFGNPRWSNRNYLRRGFQRYRRRFGFCWRQSWIGRIRHRSLVFSTIAMVRSFILVSRGGIPGRIRWRRLCWPNWWVGLAIEVSALPGSFADFQPHQQFVKLLSYRRVQRMRDVSELQITEHRIRTTLRNICLFYRVVHLDLSQQLFHKMMNADSRKGNGLIPELEISKSPLSPLENIFQPFPATTKLTSCCRRLP